MSKHMTIRISDVAARAAVSTATVSHVINNTRKVSEETKSKVWRAIHDLGYSPNVSARNLKTGRTRMIGLIIPDISNLFFAMVARQIENVLGKQEYNLITMNSDENLSKEISHIQHVTSGLVDGLIIASAAQDYAQLANYIPENFPCVFFDRRLTGNPHESVLVSSDIAMQQGVSALVKRGHKRIGYIAGLRGISTTEDRLRSYRNALQNSGAEFDPRLVQYGNSIDSTTFASIGTLVKEKCTAIVVSNNLMSAQAVYKLASIGLKVGEDIDLLTYKDYEYYSYDLTQCDMIIQPIDQLGGIIGNAILERIGREDVMAREIVLVSSFQPRMLNP